MRLLRDHILLKQIAVFIAFQTGLTALAYGQTPVANFTGSPLAGCSPLIVNFQNLSTGNPTSYSWDFGNGNTSTQQNPTATYFNPGTYTVKLTATNANGSNTLTRSQYITVYDAPTVNFSANITSGCRPLTVQFTDMSTAGAGNANTSWLWDFGNGNTSTQQNPTTTYSIAGAYTVTLSVTNDKGCSKILSKPNYINANAGPHASFTHTQPAVCRPPASISFANGSTGTGPLTFSWDFGDGSPISTLSNPTHIYNTTGSFIVTLVVTNSAGCTDTVHTSSPIVIGGTVTEFSGPDSICVNVSAAFTNTSAPAPDTALWNFGDGGTANSLNAAHVYITAGVYTVKLYNTYSNCADSVSKTIRVNANPVPDFTAPVTTKCQPPLTVNFSDNSTAAVGWQWDFGDGSPISTLQNPSHTYVAYGNFNVKLITVNSSGCTDSITKSNFVKINRAIITIPSLPTHGCLPFTISPVANINSVDAVTSYYWDFGDGATSTLATPTHTYVVLGTYTVSLVITTSSGCTDTLTINQAVKAGTKPVANFSASPTTQCAYQPIQFTDLSVPADEWNWDFGDGGTSTQQNPAYSYALPGTYNVTLVALNSGCPDTITKSSYVTALPPVARFNYAANCSNRKQFTFTDQSIGPVTWQWDFGDGSPISILQNPVHTFPALGNYNVTLTVTNGSCSHSITQTIKAIDENPDFNVNTQSGCKSLYVVMTAQNIAQNNIANYSWTFDGITYFNSTSPTIFNFYNTSGNYTLGLITTDINGCKDSIIKPNYVHVNGPIAAFNATNTSGCKGLTATFNDLSTTDGVNAIVNWQWNFGDGTIQNFSAPPFQHTYNNPGTYSVKLIITDASGCKDSAQLSNLVTTSNPQALFVSAGSFTCPGTPIGFVNQSTAVNYTSLWSFGDGNTSTIQSPGHSYLITGTFDIKLVITDQYGCSDSMTRNAYIIVDKPIASFSISDSVSSCTPFKVIFTNTSHYFNTGVWDFGDGGTSNFVSPTYYYNTPGIYTAKLVITSAGMCTDSAFKTITVYDTAGSRVDYTPFNGCKPLSINLNATSPGNYTYLWDFGDGTTQTTTTNNVAHMYSTFGGFLPKVILQDPTGCLIPITGLDTVKVVGATAKFGFDKNLLCDAGLITFTDSTTFNDAVTNYNWTFGDGGTSTQQNPQHQYLSPGNYSVQLAVKTQAGCTDTIQTLNAIKIVKSPLIDIMGDTSGCINSPMNHFGVFLQPDTSVVTWSWSFPNNNTSALQNPAAQTYSSSGNFVVSVMATNSSGCKDTATKNIVVHSLPTVTLPGTMTVQNGFPQTIPAAYSPNVINWQWSPSVGLTCTNCATPDVDPKFKTTYNVLFTDNNGCQNTGTVTVFVLCKNANLFMPNTFSPNGDGSNDVFYPRGKGLDRVKSLRIFNRWGEVVFEKTDFPINDAAYGWDGTFKGRKPQADVYIYQVEVFCENGEVIKLDGNVALIL